MTPPRWLTSSSLGPSTNSTRKLRNAPKPVPRNAKNLPSRWKSKAAAKLVGELMAARAKERGVEKVVFDRGGYVYHGRVQALAEGAREKGLQF